MNWAGSIRRVQELRSERPGSGGDPDAPPGPLLSGSGRRDVYKRRSDLWRTPVTAAQADPRPLATLGEASTRVARGLSDP
jgi:hypothetical protein